MQITNNYQPSFNYQPNFRAGRIDREGLGLLAKRLKAGEFDPFVARFKKRHSTKDYKVVLGALSKNNSKLDACITYDENNFRHMTEGFFSSMFFNPKHFMNKVNRQIDKDMISIANKGHVKGSFWNKLMWFIL